MRTILFVLFVFISSIALFTSNGCDYVYHAGMDSIYISYNYSESNYDLSKPDDELSLHYELKEISGLSYYSDGILTCIQDERGSVYILNWSKNEIIRKINFEGGGDFEGLEIIKDTCYAVTSSGDLYVFPLSTDKNEVEAEKIENELSRDNNVEGLGYDRDGNSLLIACKGSPDIKNVDVKGKAVYRFNIRLKKLNTLPEFLISDDDIEDFIDDSRVKFPSEKVNFSPSGIAQHPITGEFYLISHSGKILIVIDPESQIKEAYPLNPGIFKQPEGICFAPNGDMFISNEGRAFGGTILKFLYKSRQ